MNIHLHCLVLEGVYRRGPDRVPTCVEVAARTGGEMRALLHRPFDVTG